MKQKTFYSCEDASRILGYSKKTLTRRAHELGIKPMEINGRVFYTYEHIEILKNREAEHACA